MAKFEKIYKLTADDLGCKRNCKICERKAMVFLPGEIYFLEKKFNIPPSKFAIRYKIGKRVIWARKSIDKNCPFYKFGRCIKRKARPLDCRSYPLFPYLKNGKIKLKLDKNCPLVKSKKISKDFIKRVILAWKIANPPQWWIKIYEKID